MSLRQPTNKYVKATDMTRAHSKYNITITARGTNHQLIEKCQSRTETGGTDY